MTASLSTAINDMKTAFCLVQSCWLFRWMRSSTSSHADVPLISEEDTTGFSTEYQRRVLNKLAGRVVLLCMGIIFVSYVDRGNISLAANEICKDLRLTHSDYGTIIAIFNVGYIPSQIASNVMLKRFGAPVWLSFIVCTWGIVAAATSFVQSIEQFYVFRIALGIAEGGTFPGSYYYLGLFFPDGYVEEAYAGLNAAASFAVPLSSPIAAGLLSTDGMFGSKGWRNLLFVEGLLPIIYSIVLYFCLPKSLEAASFLDAEEKRWLMEQRTGQEEHQSSHVFRDILEISRSFPFWRMGASWWLFNGNYTVMVGWITLIIHKSLDNSGEDSGTCGSGGSSVVAVALTAIPFILNTIVCLAIRTKTHHIRNRTVLIASMQILCGLLISSWIWTRKLSFIFGFLSLTFAVALLSVPNIFAAGVVLSMFPMELRSTAMAMGNSLAALTSMGVAIAVGHMVDSYGYSFAILLCSFATLMAALCCFSVKDPLLDRNRNCEHYEDVTNSLH